MIKHAFWASVLSVGFLIAPPLAAGGVQLSGGASAFSLGLLVLPSGEAKAEEVEIATSDCGDIPANETVGDDTCVEIYLSNTGEAHAYLFREPQRFKGQLRAIWALQDGKLPLAERVSLLRAARDRLETEEKAKATE